MGEAEHYILPKIRQKNVLLELNSAFEFEFKKYSADDELRFRLHYECQRLQYLLFIRWYVKGSVIDFQMIGIQNWFGTTTIDRLEKKYRPNVTKFHHKVAMDMVLVGPKSHTLTWALTNRSALARLKLKKLRQSIDMKQMYVVPSDAEAVTMIAAFENTCCEQSE